MKIAIIHDWLTGMRGGEKCLEVFCELFGDATIFTLIHDKGSCSDTIEKMKIRPSFIQNLPNAIKGYRSYLPFFPKAIESFNLQGYDLILSSSHCAAKGVKVPKGAKHICYCYTPMRYAWVFFDEYFGHYNPVKKWLIHNVIERLKGWDIKTNESVDFFIAISDNVRARIKKYYDRESDIIYPPVDTSRFKVSAADEGFYLIVSALVPYKRIDLAIEAFNISKKKLIIIGAGNSSSELKAKADRNIKFLGWSDDKTIEDHYARSSGLIFPGDEDFGIVPVEAQACGKPVIAYAKGGALETIVDLGSTQNNPTGVLFCEQTTEALNQAIERFESNKDKFNPNAIRENAMRFDREEFKKKIREYVEARTNGVLE
ncbi:glycosyltransferase [Candidatus Omnitrophota bacterium]